MLRKNQTASETFSKKTSIKAQRGETSEAIKRDWMKVKKDIDEGLLTEIPEKERPPVDKEKMWKLKNDANLLTRVKYGVGLGLKNEEVQVLSEVKKIRNEFFVLVIIKHEQWKGRGISGKYSYVKGWIKLSDIEKIESEKAPKLKALYDEQVEKEKKEEAKKEEAKKKEAKKEEAKKEEAKKEEARKEEARLLEGKKLVPGLKVNIKELKKESGPKE